MSVNPSTRPAFFLVEMMFILGLLAFVALVAGQIFVTLNQTTYRIAQNQMAETRFDLAAALLRQDVWNASQCTLQDPHSLQIRLGEQQVTWKAGQSLRREAGDKAQSWDELQADLTFEVRGPTVVIVRQPAVGETGSRVVFLSAATILKGAAR